jgi:hypothetical protein
MNEKPDYPQTEKRSDAVATILKVAEAVAIFPAVTAVVLFVAAGWLDWTWAWVYLGINLANALIVAPITIRSNPVPVAG